MDWEKCILWQTESNDSINPSSGEGAYLSFIENIKKFKEVNACPVELITNRASWHKSCQLKFSTSRLKGILEEVEKENDFSNVEPNGKRSDIRPEVIL